MKVRYSAALNKFEAKNATKAATKIDALICGGEMDSGHNFAESLQALSSIGMTSSERLSIVPISAGRAYQQNACCTGEVRLQGNIVGEIEANKEGIRNAFQEEIARYINAETVDVTID